MKKIDKRIVMALSIVLVTGIVFYLNEIKGQNEIPKAKVVVVVKDIPENTVITDKMVAIDERVAEDALKERGYITSHLENVVGKRTVVPLYKNETVKLERIVTNEPYMKAKEEGLTDFQVEIATKQDKALNLKKGSYIDIWLEPTKEGIQLGATPQKVYENLKIKDIKEESYLPLGSNKEGASIPNFLTLRLNNEQISTLLQVNKNTYTMRISLHGENEFYKVIEKTFEDKK